MHHDRSRDDVRQALTGIALVLLVGKDLLPVSLEVFERVDGLVDLIESRLSQYSEWQGKCMAGLTVQEVWGSDGARLRSLEGRRYDFVRGDTRGQKLILHDFIWRKVKRVTVKVD